MKYITGIHALNLTCDLDTPGDWHCSALKWKDITVAESNESIFGDYGIECHRKIPEHEGTFRVANHIRALLDLIADGKFCVAQGMRDDFIEVDKYDQEIFEHIMLLKDSPKWDNINNFMSKEYKRKWINFINQN